MMVEYVAAGAIAEIRNAAQPASVGTLVLSRGAEEDATFASQGALQLERSVAAYRVLLCCELVGAVRLLRQRRLDDRFSGVLGEALALAAGSAPQRRRPRPPSRSRGGRPTSRRPRTSRTGSCPTVGVVQRKAGSTPEAQLPARTRRAPQYDGQNSRCAENSVALTLSHDGIPLGGDTPFESTPCVALMERCISNGRAIVSYRAELSATLDQS